MSTSRPASPSAARATLLVAEREVLAQLRTKSFLVSTAVLLLVVLAGIVVSAVMGGSDDGTKVAVVEATRTVVAEADGLEPVLVDDADAARALVEQEEVEAAVLPGDGPTGVSLVALDTAPTDVVAALSVQPQVELLQPADLSEGLRFVVALAFGLVFMMSAVGSGNTIAQNTVQEKQSRIVEILLSAVPARALLAGKVLGNSVVAVGQTAAIAAVSVIGLVVTGQDDLLQVLGAPIVWFVVFFLVGFVLLASMFAASASLVARLEDVGPVLQPVLWLVMVPYFLVVFFNDNPTVMTVMSYVPFSAPVGMPVRLFFGEALWWEPLVSLVVLVASTGLVIALAARIYTGSLLRTGSRVSVRSALRDARG
ncbi:ABC transporter permease [Cellulomonas soli]|uniref:ABC transporter permease n=1 Tax=Cellulomonas soli TaxID=931535 RepID=A0A512PDG0_9CELL|nr:ABC transporter permease [Cellulomonas soli]NYI60096.1 ABC-2 type transport system permease protein [Cellulomonas soli]GEP69250.1 ABC transporter permease [Cellulomonas soli]